jgi:hypothetical protein
LKLLPFFLNIKFTRNQHISKIHIYSKMLNKKMSCTRKNINISYNKLQKTLFQNSFECKSYFWAKRHVVLFKIVSLVHSFSFAPNTYIYFKCMCSRKPHIILNPCTCIYNPTYSTLTLILVPLEEIQLDQALKFM